MMPESPSPPPDNPSEDELLCAAITVIAAWRNGVKVIGDDAPKLLPAHIPHPLARAVWRAIRLHVPFAAHRHYHNIIVYAKEVQPASDSEWDALWARIEGRRDAADDAGFRTSAQLLMDQHARIEKEKTRAWGEQFEADLKEKWRREKEEREKTPAFTRQDMIDIVYHGHDPGSEGVPRDLLSYAATEPDGREASIPPVKIYPNWDPTRHFPLRFAPGACVPPSPNANKQNGAAHMMNNDRIGSFGADNGHLGTPPSAGQVEGVGRPRFDLKSAADALAPVPPMHWLVDHLLIPGGRSIWFGKPGCKKTYLLMWLAVCLALHKDFLGLKTEQTRVLFVDEESGALRMHYRLHELLLGAGAGPETPLWHIPPCAFLITNAEDRHELRRIILGEGIGLVIVDSLARVSTGDENSKKDMQRVTDGQDELAAETGAHMALIHHTPKSENSDTPRGSGVFEASPDLLMGVKSAKGSPFVNLWTEKIRDAEARRLAARCHWFTHPTDPNLNTFRMEPAEVREGNGERELSPLRQWILDYLKEHGESAGKEIAEVGVKAGVGSKYGIRDTLHDLAREELIRRTNPGDTGKAAVARFILNEPDEDI